MNEYEIHETALKLICKEIAEVIEEIKKNGMNEQRLDSIDKLYHAKKDILATWGMEHPEEYADSYSGDNGMSGYRGRNAMTGRYVSRDSYGDGYSRGYSEAMSQMNQGGNSGHMPTQNPYYPDQKRW